MRISPYRKGHVRDNNGDNNNDPASANTNTNVSANNAGTIDNNNRQTSKGRSVQERNAKNNKKYVVGDLIHPHLY